MSKFEVKKVSFKYENNGEYPDSYENRPRLYEGVAKTLWENWVWQSKNSLTTPKQLEELVDDRALNNICQWVKENGFRFRLSPYVLSLCRWQDGKLDINDPIIRQHLPIYPKPSTTRTDHYDPSQENWEKSEEMLTPILHHKYPDRAILYIADNCMGYCLYCLRSLPNPKENHGGLSHLEKSLSALKDHPEINEVILSGGDPLTYNNPKIEYLLERLREVDTIRRIRIHTRALTHNPFRVDVDFAALLQQYKVTVLALHLTHPSEITKEFVDAVHIIKKSGANTLLLAQIPFLEGINNNSSTILKLCEQLVDLGIKPYYLLHAMPNTLFPEHFRTAVRELINVWSGAFGSQGRNKSPYISPTPILVNKSGKWTIPINQPLEYDDNGNIIYMNWKGEPDNYLDAQEYS